MRPPSVDALARSLRDIDLPPPLLVEAARAAIAAGDPDSARVRAERVRRSLIQPVINATGVLLHTNLGRAPFPFSVDARPTNLELDLGSGRRGSRHERTGRLLADAVGAERALVVNNGAAAVLLAVTALAHGRPVAISRGELVEIGGGFRIPEVLAQSGAELREVGTTNRTRLSDYDLAVAGVEDAVVLKVHQSNYRIVGFTEQVDVKELASLPHRLVVDLGSGLLDERCPWLEGGPPAWLVGEPGVRQTLEAGADLVTFSGDKLLGGPQAGVLAGSADVIEACARHPLARALRPGSLTLAALEAVVLAYLRRDGLSIPFWRMATASVAELTGRASELGHGEVVSTAAVAGGGTLPEVEIPSVGVAIDGDHLAELRRAPTPVVARVVEGRTVCDLRTVGPDDDEALAEALARLGPR